MGFTTPPPPAAFEFVFGDGTTVMEGTPYLNLVSPFNGVLQSIQVVADHDGGDFIVDIRKCAKDAYPAMTSVVGGVFPTLAAVAEYFDDVLDGWDTEVSEGEIWQCIVTSLDSAVSATISLQVKRT